MERRGLMHWLWCESHKIALGRPIPRWNYSIRIEFGEIGWVGMNWIQLAEDRNHTRGILNMAMNLQIS
jgi:hypothetical protein